MSFVIDYEMWTKILKEAGISNPKHEQIYHALQDSIWGLNCEFLIKENPLVRHYARGEKVDRELIRKELHKLRFAYNSEVNLRKYNIKDKDIGQLGFAWETEDWLRKNKIDTLSALLWTVDDPSVDWGGFHKDYVAIMKAKAAEIKKEAAHEESLRGKINKSRGIIDRLNFSYKEKAIIMISRASESQIRGLMPTLEANLGEINMLP